MKEKVAVADLAIGMFVTELDRPWLETPFLLQGFLVESQQDIDRLRQYCGFVYVEPERSTGSAYRPPPRESDETRAKPAATPGGTPATDLQRDVGSSLWDTIKRILGAAFAGGAPAGTGQARKSARTATGEAHATDAGEAAQFEQFRRGGISAAELDYLVPQTRVNAGGSALSYGEGSGSTWPGLLSAIRRWFGRGARIEGRRHEEGAGGPDVPPPVYPDLNTFEAELPKAREAYEQTRLVVDQVIADVRANKPIEVRKVQEAVLSMVESVVRNANGFMWLSRLKVRDATAYDHGLNVAVFLLSFGRHLGLPKGLLEILGTAGLMQDVGKLRLPSALLDKRTALTAAERDILKTHVMHSVEILEASQTVSPLLVETVAQHHERFDGSGYPKGLKGDEISMLGAMAGIVDTYAAMTRARPYREPALPQDVLQQLYGWRGTLFNPELVEKFIQCIGIFPVGSMVELNTREVAIVMAHSQVRRLKPRLMLILDHDQQPYSTPIMLEMINDPPTPSGEPYRIVRGLQTGADSIELYEKAAAAEARKQLSGA
jgi:HD-GYP domain-containing protein (c-di-GMP phosphodiesterase class II)